VRGLLTEACPGLAEAFAEEDADSSERLNYLEINAAVRWLATRVRDGDESCLPAVFEVAELVLIDGTKRAQDLVVVGLFEDLQNHDVTGGVAWSVWERYLGPLSRDAGRPSSTSGAAKSLRRAVSRTRGLHDGSEQRRTDGLDGTVVEGTRHAL
jgi:hypothetical protein